MADRSSFYSAHDHRFQDAQEEGYRSDSSSEDSFDIAGEWTKIIDRSGLRVYVQAKGNVRGPYIMWLFEGPR